MSKKDKKNKKKDNKNELKMCVTLSMLKTAMFQAELRKSFNKLSKKHKDDKVEVEYFGIDESGTIKNIKITNKSQFNITIPFKYTLYINGEAIIKPVDVNTTEDNKGILYLLSFNLLSDYINNNDERKIIIKDNKNKEYLLEDISEEISAVLLTKNDKIKVFFEK